MIIEKDGYKFEIDIEATKKYYENNEVCDCDACKNFQLQAKEAFPKLDEFLSAFGANILRPDEVSWIQEVDDIDYIDITYTVCGKIIEGSGYEVDLYDSLFLSVFIDNKYVPNSHKDEDWFSLTVFNVKLPFIVEKE